MEEKYPPSAQLAFLSEYIAQYGYAADAIASYERFVTEALPRIVAEHGGNICVAANGTEHRISFRKITAAKPVVHTVDAKTRSVKYGAAAPLLASEARLRNLTYNFSVMCDVVHQVCKRGRKTSSLAREQVLLNFPAMVRSRYCHTSDDARGECQADEGGYYLIHGPRVLQPQREQRQNILIVQGVDESGKKTKTVGAVSACTYKRVAAHIRSIRADDKFRSSSTLYADATASPASLFIKIPYLPQKKAPVAAIFKLLGVSEREAEKIIWPGGGQTSSARRIFRALFADPVASKSEDEILDFLGCGVDASAAGYRAATAVRVSRKRKRDEEAEAEEEDAPDDKDHEDQEDRDEDHGDDDAEDNEDREDGQEDEKEDGEPDGAHVEDATEEGAAPASDEDDEEIERQETEALASAASADAQRAAVHRVVRQQMRGELLPHCGFDDSPATKLKKALYLGLIVRRMIDVMLGLAAPDDLDAEGTKALQMSYAKLTVMFRQRFCDALKKLRSSLFKAARDGKDVRIHELVAAHITAPLTQAIARHFAAGELTVQKDGSNGGDGVIQNVAQTNPLGLSTHVQRVRTVQHKTGGYLMRRGVDATHLLSYDPAETPEGDTVGLLANLTQLAHVRPGARVDDVTAALLDLLPAWRAGVDIRPFTHARDGRFLVFVNSDPVATVGDVDAFLATAREARRHGVLPYDCTITSTRAPWRAVNVWSDAGVVTFPLLNLAELRKVDLAPFARRRVTATPGAVDAHSTVAPPRVHGETLLAFLSRHHVVEYHDAAELQEVTLAFLPEEVDARDAAIAAAADHGGEVEAPFTHLCPHPCGMLSTSTSTVPHPNMSQAARVNGHATMAKQAIGYTAFNMLDAMHYGYSHQLQHPQAPLVNTEGARAARVHDIPQGANEIVAIASFHGMTGEDSIVRCRASVERGAARVTLRRVFSHVLAPNQVFQKPRDGTLGMRAANYVLDDDGLPSEGDKLCSGDAVIGVVLRTEGGQDRDFSVFLPSGREQWVVDRVMVTTTAGGAMMAKVRCRTLRIQQCGDKATARHAQKGIVGWMPRMEDVPFVASGPNAGMVPDLIVNPCGLPSRMTIGMLLE